MADQNSLLILDDYQSVSATMADWSPLEHLQITRLTTAIPPSDVVEQLSGFTMIHAMRERTKLTADILKKLPKLKFITTTGAYNRGIDLDACNELGIVVSGTWTEGAAHGSSGTVEQTWALILACARRIVPEYESVRSGGWQTGIATCLNGKTLGLIGAGRLGRQVGTVAKAFGMRVQAWSPNLDAARAAEAGVELAPSLEALLSASDVVSIHMVLAPSTKGLLGAKELALLKPDAILVNTSRGPLIDEAALVAFLKGKQSGGVGLDVFDQEPLPLDHPLRTLNNAVVSPHMGYVDDVSYKEWWPQTVENIQAFLSGKPIRILKPRPLPPSQSTGA